MNRRANHSKRSTVHGAKLGAGLGIVLLGLLAGVGCEPAGPSILLVTLDTTRADRLGAYGYEKPTSPNFDALARSGVVFEAAISSASNTPVSHASILTGQHPYHHGLRVLHGQRHNRLPDSARTLAEHFQARGYRTGAFVSALPVAQRFGLDQGFEHYDDDFLESDREAGIAPDGTVNTGLSQRRADATTDRAVAWLEAQRAPVLLWVHYFDPHDVLLLPPKEFVDPRQIEGIQRDKLRALYDEEIRFMDLHLGRLLEAFDALVRNGIVVVVADHGEGLGDHDWWTHGTLYQEQIRVPLVVRAPGTPAGQRVRHRVRTIDIAPTLLDLAGLLEDDEREMDGRSLVPLLTDPEAEIGDAPTYSDSFSPMVYQAATLDPMIRFSDEREDVLVALIRDGYKYIHHLGHPERSELYDLRTDPREVDNRLRTEPEIAHRLCGELRKLDWRLDTEAVESPMDPETIDRLSALGYVPTPAPDAREPDLAETLTCPPPREM